jgi:hypothetical protein
MIHEIKAYDVSCSVCEKTWGLPDRSLAHALDKATRLATHEGWERDGERIVCPKCARERWQRECASNLVLSGD